MQSGDVPAILERASADAFDRASRGEQSASEARALVSGAAALPTLPADVQALFTREPKQLVWMLRFLYTRQVSWSVWHREWLDSCAKLMHKLAKSHSESSSEVGGSPLVLELCAGRGLLREPMEKRGLRWLCTDVKPGGASSSTEQCSALDALERHTPDVVFWSWWSHDKKGKAEDSLAAARCWQRGIPVVFIGEGEGGCTGSAALWQGPWAVDAVASGPLAAELDEPFVDVIPWEGFTDRTYCILPKRPGAHFVEGLLEHAVL